MKSKATPTKVQRKEWPISILNGNAAMNQIGPPEGALYLILSGTPYFWLSFKMVQ